MGIWLIFRSPLKKTTISNLKPFGVWCLIMIPAIFILAIWTIVSTPTASLEERNGNEHYVCTTGGFTGKPGGLIFFFLFVAYCSLVLLIGALISILSRNAPA